jgi:hypothetical protein
MNLHGMYRWFGVVPQGWELFFPSFFVVIFGALCWWSFEDDLLGFLVCVTSEDLVPLWLVTLPPNLSWIGLDLVVFRVGRVLELVMWFLRFLLIVSDSGRFLWDRGCPGGNPAIPEVSLQSVEWFGRLGAGKLRFDPRVGFLEGAV